MGCGKKLFDLNEPPPEEEEASCSTVQIQPQKTIPSANPLISNLLILEQNCQPILNNHAFTHAPSSSGFQPFVRSTENDNTKESVEGKADDSNANQGSSSVVELGEEDIEATEMMPSDSLPVQDTEREEGELCDMEGNDDFDESNNSNKMGGPSVIKDTAQVDNQENELYNGILLHNNNHDSYPHTTCKNEADDDTEDTAKDVNCASSESANSRMLKSSSKRDRPVDEFDDTSAMKSKDARGAEANHSLKIPNHPGKRQRLDEHKEAMLGKRRARQTVFIPMEDVRQVGPVKTSTSKRQASSLASSMTRSVKETNRTGNAIADRTAERQNQLLSKDQRKSETSAPEGGMAEDLSNQSDELKDSIGRGAEVHFKKVTGKELSMGDCMASISRQGSFKHPVESRQQKSSQMSFVKVDANFSQSTADPRLTNKKLPPPKRQMSNITQCLDSSVERLLREATNEKFWRHPEDTELQCVPEHFDSVEEYIQVFEPLLFEECRAQLYSTWEELAETVSKDAPVIVQVKLVERRERGWYDVIALPNHECKWTFKEGDVAVLSVNRPDTFVAARSKRNNSNSSGEDITDVTSRIAGTVRRHIPIDTRDPSGIALHFYVGESYGTNSKSDEEHILRKLQPKSTWFLTVLGSLTTTQREYVALHAFRRLNSQMQSAILKPSSEHFPKYGEHTPAMPECFTQNFVDHLHKTFNGPQLAAIQWAAVHTAAGTTTGMSRRQDPWPFTLVQGPPGTGKTHTVWGMLNVIHLVQYQRYYTALLKKLAPESYKQAGESNYEGTGSGSIDEVLQSMDQNLFRTLPKLCPKPRILVCAPSNAATDELLARVLDRGFIDGELKVYRPDVARVGVDSQTRAAQAVSVERRTEQLLLKGREEVVGWLHQLKIREAQFSQQISLLQRELNAAAAAGRSQGSMGIDPDVLVARDHNRDVLLQNLAAAVEGRDKILVEMSRFLILEKKFRAPSNFDAEDVGASLEASFANEAEIVFTTVSSSGRKIFSRLSHGFDMVVIDEAAQASEVAVLPPLSLDAARCVLVGDPQQLPATVISKAAGNLLYSRSLFERLQQGGCPTILLSVQYRMHPQIRDFPSRYFYQGRLTDSESINNLADEPYYRDPLLPPYAFYDVTHGRESQRGGSVSFQNIQEAQFSFRLYEHLQKFLKSNGGKKVSFGIITPYKLQLRCIQREFEEVLNSDEAKELYINTVDAFQGQERDVIIMSCVRASSHGVGFVADIRRMNVALTRARRALWVVGNANALMQSDDWSALIMDAKSRKCFIEMDRIPKEFMGPRGCNISSGRISSNIARNSRSNMQRSKYVDSNPESKQFDENERSNAYISRNGSYRNLKPIDGSTNELAQLGDKSSVDSSQFGGYRRQIPRPYRRDI